MGQSGAGGGGGGSGGAGGSTSGGGGGGYAKAPATAKAAKAARTNKARSKGPARDAAQRVFSRLKPSYLERQFLSPLPSGLVKDLVLMAVDLRRGGRWQSLCARLALTEAASLQDVRDAIFARNSGEEHDQRIIGASRATLIAFFEELTRFDDALLVRKGRGASWSAGIDQEVLVRTLPHFLMLLMENVLQREEDQSLGSDAREVLRTLAERRALNLVDRLRRRYEESGESGDARVLQRAGQDETERGWFVGALRG